MSSALSVGPAPSSDDPVSVLGGAGPATAARLAAAGLATVGDLLSFLPHRYDDLRRLTRIAALNRVADGELVVVCGQVQRLHLFPRRFLEVTLEQDGATLRARWFRAPAGLSRSYPKGATVALAGALRTTNKGERALSHPTNVTALLTAARGSATASEDVTDSGLGLRPRYAVVEKVGARLLEKLVAAAVARYAALAVDVLPPSLSRRLGLPTLPDALTTVHTPASAPGADLDALVAGTAPAQRRLAVEDLLILQLGFAARRARARALGARASGADPGQALAVLRAALPFALTEGQQRALAEIYADLGAAAPMQRLLIGDVGSGKTAVAFAAAAFVAASGGQTLMMVPTEGLADQHLRSVAALLPAGRPGGLRAALLTSSTTRVDRAAVLGQARAGALDLLIGTQALLEEQVLLRDLRLAIVDEQHRFGVAQRGRLRRAGSGEGASPHLLVMSATPIPRSLALTLHGDLDATLLTERPPGRRSPRTIVCDGDAARDQAYQKLRDGVAEGRQGFVVCPSREMSLRDGGITAAGRHAELTASLAPARVGLVHGALDGRRKEASLRAFARGTCDVLVATTVIELGIDVTNATVMVVEEAERFGLATLHQLRGRVGRGSDPGTCFLCTGSTGAVSDAARERLRQLELTDDGFKIAEIDLQQRGHGDLFGAKQAGVPALRIDALKGYLPLLEVAREEAQRLLARDPSLDLPEHRPLRAAIQRRWAAGNLFAEETG